MGDAIKIIVYDKDGKNVTDERDWMIDKDGYLRYECDDIDCPVVTVGEGYFYELEVTTYVGNKVKVSPAGLEDLNGRV